MKMNSLNKPILGELTLKNILVFLLSFFMVSAAYSNPELSSVTAGNVEISQSANSTVVNQSSQQAIIEWHSFNIDAREKTQFVQPNVNAVALNRVDPNQGISQIFGALSANGKIVIVN